MRVLLTGFEPFGDVRVNPSQMIVGQIMASRRFTGLTGAVLPVKYAAAAEQMRLLIGRHRPQAVVCLGVAQGRDAINLERFALNVDDAPIADNDGVLKQGEPITPDGPLAYVSTLPLAAMLDALRARHIPAVISNHAGAYLCNHVFYVARHLTEGRGIPCGFIHVPPLAGEASPQAGGLPLQTMVEAVAICLALLQNESC
jgi:pyroglutamyl-peptidase